MQDSENTGLACPPKQPNNLFESETYYSQHSQVQNDGDGSITKIDPTDSLYNFNSSFQKIEENTQIQGKSKDDIQYQIQLQGNAQGNNVNVQPFQGKPLNKWDRKKMNTKITGQN